MGRPVSPVISRINEMDLVGQKGTYTDWGMRVPALVAWPPIVPLFDNTWLLLTAVATGGVVCTSRRKPWKSSST